MEGPLLSYIISIVRGNKLSCFFYWKAKSCLSGRCCLCSVHYTGNNPYVSVTNKTVTDQNAKKPFDKRVDTFCASKEVYLDKSSEFEARISSCLVTILQNRIIIQSVRFNVEPQRQHAASAAGDELRR
jgi:hypothetical protein